MEQTVGSQKFTFGDVQQTQYVAYDIVDTEVKLPYNPFVFDFRLSIMKTKPNYEQVSTSYPLSRQKKSVFGRKKKVNKQWSDSQSVPIYLNAEIISEKHFSISQSYELKDQNSKHGTYVWIDRYHPLKLQLNDTFLVAKLPFVITKIQLQPKTMIEATFQGKNIQICQNKRIFLIGSHKKCDLVVSSLYQFEVCINLGNFTIFTNLDEEQACSQHGLWYKLRNDKLNNKFKLEYGSLILVQPYLFKVIS